ncbi:DNA recombination protein RmuC [Candidatus Xianfuyuplasma coldseepsis]|uniref:DNA recombination protein RmuC n=1 Tax=Candidatus Xianfuyuplasma coldseepsis TaxID=2782163 RepID=A0A7L7KSP3_9MOLU|nr:DNA recombination protein RmuC [Xianfuyuplasma coldseepsis]QMS84964.1 DNA recombination protein RmuC [Xianfuyuplasma coldseepsis]
MTTGEIVIIAIAAIILLLELYKIMREKPANDRTDEVVDALKEESNKSLQQLIKELGEFHVSVTKSMGESSKDNIKDLNEFKDSMSNNIVSQFELMNKRIEEQMDRINHKVNTRLEEGFEKTNKTFTNIVERLTKIDEAQKNIEQLSTEVVSLQHLLSDKKARGTFGEVQLNHILSAIFGENNKKVYDTQVKLSNNMMVDALLYLPDEMGNLAIDSKFPLENYQRMVDRELTDRERELATRAFKADMKKHIDAIATKYIIPTETSDQAVLFVPAEAIFAEINAYHQEVVDYAQSKRVWIASPTTLMSLLTTVQVLLRNVERDKYAKVIQEELVKLGTEFSRYQERWDKLSRNIDTVSKSVKDIHTTSNKIGKRFKEISHVDLELEEPEDEE